MLLLLPPCHGTLRVDYRELGILLYVRLHFYCLQDINVIYGVTARELATDHAKKDTSARSRDSQLPRSKIQFSLSPCNNATMHRVKCPDAATDRENDIREAKHAYSLDLEPCIHTVALTYVVPYETLRDQLRGAQPRSAAHEKEQLHTLEEEKSIDWFCETEDDLGHLLQAKMVKAFVMSHLPPFRQRQLGKHWITRFLNCHPAVTAKFSQCLYRQTVNANDPAILNDFFRNIYHFSLYIYFKPILVTVAWKSCQKVQCTTRKHLQHE